MPLEILLVLVVVGIGSVVVLLNMLGLSRQHQFADRAAAQAAWLREFPDDTVRAVTLSDNGRSALIETKETAGVVWAMGADTTARPITGARIKTTESGLSLKLQDFTAPAVALSLTQAEASAWQARLQEHI